MTEEYTQARRLIQFAGWCVLSWEPEDGPTYQLKSSRMAGRVVRVLTEEISSETFALLVENGIIEKSGESPVGGDFPPVIEWRHATAGRSEPTEET